MYYNYDEKGFEREYTEYHANIVKICGPIYHQDNISNNEYIIISDSKGLYQCDMTEYNKISTIEFKRIYEFQSKKMSNAAIIVTNGNEVDLDNIHVIHQNSIKIVRKPDEMKERERIMQYIRDIDPGRLRCGLYEDKETMNIDFEFGNSVIYKAILINDQYHLFCFDAKENVWWKPRTHHFRMDKNGKVTKIITIKSGKDFKKGEIPKLLEIFYIKKMNKIIAIDPDINSKQQNGSYIKKIYSCDIANNYKWSMNKVRLNNIKNMGYHKWNGCINIYEIYLVLFCNLGIFVIDLQKMKSYNINKRSFGPELRSFDGVDPGKMHLVVNEKKHMLYGFHFRFIAQFKDHFFPPYANLKVDLFELLPNEFPTKSKLIISGLCREMEEKNKTIMVPAALTSLIDAYYSEFE